MLGPEEKGSSSSSGSDGWDHNTSWEGDSRQSYDIKPDNSGGWHIKDAHVTNQDLPKGHPDRHNPNR